MEHIVANTTEALFNIVSEKEKKMQPKEKLIMTKPENWCLIDFNEENYPEGRFNLASEGVKFECFFHYNRNKKLYVMFSGGRLKTDKPLFNRWSYYPFADGCVLCIDDPMHDKYKNLLLGWYYGTEEISYRQILVNIVNKIAESFKIERKDIVFYSSSGGASAALDCVSQIDGAQAIVINPQVCLSLYPMAKHFEEITHIDLKKLDKYNRNDVTCKLSRTTSKIVVMVNIASKDDQIQLDYLLKSLEQPTVDYGISKLRENIVLWTYNADIPDAHGAQDWKSIFFCLRYLINLYNIDDVKELYLLFNDFIADRYKQIHKCESKYDKFKEFYLFPYEKVNYNEKIVIYGAGCVGKSYVKQIRYNRYCRIIMWCDKKASIKLHDGIQLDTPDNILKYQFDRILIAIYDEKIAQSVIKYLQDIGIDKDKIIHVSHNKITDLN